MILFHIILIIIGLALLIAGAEGMVRGSASLAKRLGISPLVIGLTIVAFGTSAPELIANLIAAAKGAQDIGIGNVVGSNISNILLILGTAGLMSTITIKSSTVWKEIPFAILAAVLVFVMGNDQLFGNAAVNSLSTSDGIVLVSLLVIFMYYVFGLASNNKENGAEPITSYSMPLSITMVALGILGLFFGGNILVDNAVILAQKAQLSEAMIGLTIVAIGTSLPELVTVISAARHKHTDLAVGNVIGSNIFNVFWILGFVAIISPTPYNTLVNPDVIIMIAATILLFAVMFIGQRQKIQKREGIVFIVLFVMYISYTILRG